MPDLPTRIKALAEMERPCRYFKRVDRCGILIEYACVGGKISMNGQMHTPHELCGGTGRIVPFKALRIPSHTAACSEYSRAVKYDHTPDEQCPGYRLEPDVEKACWRIEKVLRASTEGRMFLNDAVFLQIDMADAVISAAETWAKEAQRG